MQEISYLTIFSPNKHGFRRKMKKDLKSQTNSNLL